MGSLIEYLVIDRGLSVEHADIIYNKLHTHVDLLTEEEINLIHDYYHKEDKVGVARIQKL